MSQSHYKIDAIGLRCPDPIMMIRKQFRVMQSGEILKIIADDISTTWDIPRFCLHLDHILLESQTTHPPFVYLIQKR